MTHSALAPELEPFQPVEVVNPNAASRFLLLCDHASNAVPPGYGDLGLPPEDFARHIAYDVGAEAVTRTLARMLDCPAILSRFSRLFIDPNRSEDDPTLVMKLSDGSIVPGNRGADAIEIEHRIEMCHRPYHRAIEEAISKAASPILVSIHSFTPQLRGRSERPWHLGVLWDPASDPETARALMDRLAQEPGLVVGDNQPYRGDLHGDCLWRHGTQNRLRNVLIEIRNDLIVDEIGQLDWATRLGEYITDAL